MKKTQVSDLQYAFETCVMVYQAVQGKCWIKRWRSGSSNLPDDGDSFNGQSIVTIPHALPVLRTVPQASRGCYEGGASESQWYQ